MNNYGKEFVSLNTVTHCLEKKTHLLNTGRLLEIKNIIGKGSVDEKKVLGKELSELRQAIIAAADSRIQEIQIEAEKDTFVDFDPTFYTKKSSYAPGKLHPVHLAMNEMIEVFKTLGFDITDGPFVDTQWFNFDSLNMMEFHPARGMQDTFYLNDTDEDDRNLVLRTQTSNLQIRYGEQHLPPFKMITPGLVFRNESMDATHDVMFHQLEGLIVAKRVSMAHLSGLLKMAFQQFFKKDDLQIRLRPSYFPFVNPGVEVDSSCVFCEQKGCKICKQTGWIEICGAGLVHPKVLENMKIDPEQWQGLAFGMGFTRIAMLKYGVQSITPFHEGNLEFLRGN
jgi:phenylalanyl-tRNA synthetase alpha chain